MGLATVRSIRSPRRLGTAQQVEAFEPELVDQYTLAMAASGITDRHTRTGTRCTNTVEDPDLTSGDQIA